MRSIDEEAEIREFSFSTRVINPTKSRVIHLCGNLKRPRYIKRKNIGYLQRTAATMKFTALIVLALSPVVFSALPTPVSVATAKTFLAERKSSARIQAPMIHTDTRPRMISCRRSGFQRSSL